MALLFLHHGILCQHNAGLHHLLQVAAISGWVTPTPHTYHARHRLNGLGVVLSTCCTGEVGSMHKSTALLCCCSRPVALQHLCCLHAAKAAYAAVGRAAFHCFEKDTRPHACCCAKRQSPHAPPAVACQTQRWVVETGTSSWSRTAGRVTDFCRGKGLEGMGIVSVHAAHPVDTGYKSCPRVHTGSM